MLQDGKNMKSSVPADFEGVVAQLSALRNDLAKLAQSVSATAESRGRKMATDISDGVGEAVHYVERKGLGAEAQLEKSVASHPFLALGLAAGAGLLLGALTRR
jgi:ElaB/YqjD/DUF883 family membrane-anchored ribosome-binding protein